MIITLDYSRFNFFRLTLYTVDLKWTKIPKDAEVGLNQELELECDAIGSPEPTFEWLKHEMKDHGGNNGKFE